MAEVKKKKKTRAFSDEAPEKAKKGKKGKSFELVTVNMAAEHRPKEIEDYVGQDHILKVFKGWQKTGKVPATILISGNTGSGKTTLARMIARYVNCDTFSSCGKCRSCKMGTAGHPDILQYDMGMKGKVDEARNMVESSGLSPIFKRRVFILDESHLMTTQAESSLLVTTEEPPAGTMWIFCTTNPEKMKDTIRGRCTHLPINAIEPEIIAGRLTDIAKAEGLWPKDKEERKSAVSAVKTIAGYSEGQMRRAIGLLQTMASIVEGGGTFSKSAVNEAMQADPEIQLDEKAVQFVAAYLSMDLIGTVQFLREANNPRGLLVKARWLIHSIIGHLTETNKYQTAPLKMFLNLHRTASKSKDDKFALNLPRLINLQSVLNSCEIAFNSTSVPADIMMESSVCNLMVDVYEGKIKI